MEHFRGAARMNAGRGICKPNTIKCIREVRLRDGFQACQIPSLDQIFDLLHCFQFVLSHVIVSSLEWYVTLAAYLLCAVPLRILATE